MEINIKSLLKLAITYPIVYYFHGLTAGYLSGISRIMVVIAVSIIVWILISRFVLPAPEARSDGRLNLF